MFSAFVQNVSAFLGCMSPKICSPKRKRVFSIPRFVEGLESRCFRRVAEYLFFVIGRKVHPRFDDLAMRGIYLLVQFLALLVYLDESGVNINLCNDKAWGKRGEELLRKKSGNAP